MVRSYNPRSGSLGSHSKKFKEDSERLGSKEQRRPQVPSVARRKVVRYSQSATEDISGPPVHDEHIRYSRYRKREKSIRVLSSPGQSRFIDKGSPAARNPRAQAGAFHEDERNWLQGQKGITIREHRIQQSKATQKRSRAPFMIIISILSVVALLVVAGLIYVSPAFTVKNVELTGAERLSQEHLSTLVGDMSGTTLLRIDKNEITSKLLTDPWISSVEIKRSFPSTMVVVVTERKVAATVELTSLVKKNIETTHWLISSDGLWLGEVDLAGDAVDPMSLLSNVTISKAELETIPKIKDASISLTPDLGASVSDEGIANALAIINGLSSDMLSKIRSISAPDKVKTALTLNNNVEVAFGAAEDVSAKEKVITALLQEHEGKIVYINVRVVDRATYRSA